MKVGQASAGRSVRWWFLAIAAGFCALAGNVAAVDPPHGSGPGTGSCERCHTLHSSAGGKLNNQAGNANVCLSCHVPAGQAAPRPFANSNAALPPLPNPAGWTAGAGTSHRWDSGPSGHVQVVSGNTSPGRIASGGTFTGRIEEMYTVTISTAGNVGTARFNWTSLRNGSGSGVLSGTNVPIGTLGLNLSFANGAASPSFKLADQWTLRVRTDLRLPVTTDGSFERPLGQRVMREEIAEFTFIGDPKVVCSTCHDQHSQTKQPFDAAAPAYAAPDYGWTGTGVGRHFQRQDNNSNQMCVICHSARNVTSATGGSHAVGIPIPAGDSRFKTPAALPLAAGQIVCMSCHAPHYTDSGGANGGLGDGFLLRQNTSILCLSCHTSSGGGDTNPFVDNTAGAHFNSTTGALWPGGQYGSSFPAHTADKRGQCINCHWPHGWPDAATPTQDYPRLWVERYDSKSDRSDPADAEILCYTCHDGVPAQTNIRADFLKGTNGTSIFHHPVNDTEQTSGRSVECVDCHNPHKATAADRHAGVAGTDLNGNTIAAGSRQLVQYELCFKCHGDTFNSSRAMTSNKRLDFNTGAANSAYHPVAQAGRGQSANLAAQLRGGLTTASTLRCTDCHNSDAFSANVGAVSDSPSLTFGPHGSTYAPILRANFSQSYTSSGSWSTANASLCFNCHDSTKLLGSNSNFSDSADPSGSKGKGNLHAYHLSNKQVTASCQSCHFDIHSNRSASNTEYRWTTDGTNYSVANSPPANVKTHLVNFAPDVQALSFTKPRWQINTVTGVRTCDLTCHGSSNKMQNVTYKVSSGDEATHTY